MKRLITFICLIIIIVVGYFLVKNGFENDYFNISSYETIEEKSTELTKKLAEYDQENQDKYNEAANNLNVAMKGYKVSKEKYETIFAELADVIDNGEGDADAIEEIIYSDKEKYKVDFLLVTLGDYGAKEGVDVVYQLSTSSTIDPNSATLNYFLADLKFTVTGQYIDVTRFIEDLEDDEKLEWEINNFEMASGTANGYTGVTAVFWIKDVPIDSESFIASEGFDNINGDQTDAQSTTTNSVSNTTNTTTTSTVSNTVVSNNTVN